MKRLLFIFALVALLFPCAAWGETITPSMAVNSGVSWYLQTLNTPTLNSDASGTTSTILTVVGNTLLTNQAKPLDDDIKLISLLPRLAVVQNAQSAGDHLWLIEVGNNANAAIFNGAKTRSTGTDAAVIVQSTDPIFSFQATASDGAGRYRTAARINFSVDGTPGSADMPGLLTFETTPDGAASPVERMRINNAGNLGFGTSSLSNGAGTFEFGSGTTPTTFPNPGFVSLIVSGVSEMFAYDCSGSFKQLSADNGEGEVGIYHFNVYTGKTVNINLETGEKRIYIDNSKKLNPEKAHKNQWIKQYIADHTTKNVDDKDRIISAVAPTKEEAEAAAVTGFKFDWATMPKFVRQAWGK